MATAATCRRCRCRCRFPPTHPRRPAPQADREFPSHRRGFRSGLAPTGVFVDNQGRPPRGPIAVRRSSLLFALVVCASVPSGAIADDKPTTPAAKPAAAPTPAPAADKPAADKPAADKPAAAPTATQPNANPAGSRPAASPANRGPKVKVDYVVAMVNDELEVQAAEAAKIEVESGEVQAALDDIKQQNNLDDAGLAAALSAQGFTLANYKQEVRRQMLRLRAENQLIAPKIQVSEEDVRARYDQMARRTEQVQAVKLSHMLFKLPEHPTEQQIAEAKEKAAKAIARVKGGE